MSTSFQNTELINKFKNFQPRVVANNSEIKSKIEESSKIINSFDTITTGVAVLFSGLSVERVREIGVH